MWTAQQIFMALISIPPAINISIGSSQIHAAVLHDGVKLTCKGATRFRAIRHKRTHIILSAQRSIGSMGNGITRSCIGVTGAQGYK